jgi:flagellar biosynthesis protein FliR
MLRSVIQFDMSFTKCGISYPSIHLPLSLVQHFIKIYSVFIFLCVDCHVPWTVELFYLRNS